MNQTKADKKAADKVAYREQRQAKKAKKEEVVRILDKDEEEKIPLKSKEGHLLGQSNSPSSSLKLDPSVQSSNID
jgi:hypothetical protein